MRINTGILSTCKVVTSLLLRVVAGPGAQGRPFKLVKSTQTGKIDAETARTTVSKERSPLRRRACLQLNFHKFDKKKLVAIAARAPPGSCDVLALRCRARAGFSRRSRENPDVWFRPCIAGQVTSQNNFI